MIHLITGGSGSGKSAYAERWLTGAYSDAAAERTSGAYPDAAVEWMLRAEIGQNDGSAPGKTSEAKRLPCLYIAAMKPFGEETRERIARHRQQRAGKGFLTIERETDLSGLTLPGNAGVLLECVSNLAANELFSEDGSMRRFSEAKERILTGIAHVAAQTNRLAIVTNEVFSDVQRYSDETKTYIRLLGEINQRLSQEADLVTEVVYGIALCRKGRKTDEKQL